MAAFHYSHAKTQLTCGLIISDRPVEFDTLPFATSTQLVTRLRYANMYPIPFTTRSSADADNALDANEAGIRVIRGVPNFRKSIT